MSNSAHELTRKEMKGPDKFQAAATSAVAWAGARKKLFALGAAAAAAALLVALGVSAWRSGEATKAGSLLYRTLVAADGEISSVPLPGVAGPLYRTDAERQQAVVEAARRVRERFPSSAAAVAAALAEADAHYRLGAFDAALEGYRRFLDGAPKDDPLRFGALDGVARVHEAKGQLDEAAKAWAEAGALKSFADRAALERARVLARAGKIAEARELLSGFGAAHEDSPLRAEADARLAALGK